MLTFPFPSQYHYSVINYPGGEIQVRVNPELIPEVRAADEISINARVNGPSGLVQLVLYINALKGVNWGANYTLNLPYLPYARADRRFVDGDCHGLHAFGRLLDAAGHLNVRTLDVHNHPAAKRRILNLDDIQPTKLIERAILSFGRYAQSDVTILFPDEGAANRYKCLTDAYPLILSRVLHASKKRDPETGAFIEFDVPEPECFAGNAVLIVDDICDGGGTFAGIAAKMHARGHFPSLGLYVTHGIFSKGPLADFVKVYTTNSVKDWWDTPVMTVMDAFHAMDQQR